MTSILTLAGRCFAVLAVTIGLSFYGCMDIASVNPVAELASLTVTPGTLQPAFTSGTTQYTVDLTRDVTSVRITAQPAVAGDTLTINGQTTTSSTIALGPEGSTTSVSIVVSESTNNSRTYIVLLKRASLAGNNSLASLAVSDGTLAPAFNANTQNYSVDVANDVKSVTVTPTLQDSVATMTVNGDLTTSGQANTVFLNGPGKSTVIPIVVTAQNGNEKTYQVTVNRGKSGNNFLDDLTISPGPLNPSFAPGAEGYTVNLPSILPGNPTNMTVTPTLQDATASMTVNGQPATSGQAQTTPLPEPGLNTFINIVVTAQNNTQRIYTVNVIRAAPSGNNNLSALSVTPGTLSPPVFDSNHLGYTVDVATDVTEVIVSATKSDSNAVLSGAIADPGVGQATGQATILLGGPGTANPISITVTAPNGVPKTYTITVNRAAPAAPPAPTNAPDLTDASDDGSSNTDDITSISTPSFEVSAPAADEIPSLYVDGGKVLATFDGTTNTLTPTTPLVEGAHSITSTVTNTATTLESLQSPPVSVTITTTPP